MVLVITRYPSKTLKCGGAVRLDVAPRPDTALLPATHTVFQVPVQSWFDDMTDTELLDLIPFFEGLSQEDDVYSMLHRLCSR